MDILSFILGLQKGKSMGGGSSADVRYVTFIGADGAVLYKKAVAVGDDCVDVLTKNLISTPTKEMTVAEVYTFNGWSLTSGGAVSSDALKNVTEDRTVYAAFTASARFYTITYYDGDTILRTEQLSYGTMPSYAPTKVGYMLMGFEPELVAVTSDANYIAVFEESQDFAHATWDYISRMSKSGRASSVFNVGDERIETLTWSDGTTEELTLQIGKIYDDKTNDGTEVITIIPKNLLSKPSAFASSNGKYLYAFEKEDYATILAPFFNTVISGLSDDLQSVLQEAEIKNGATAGPTYRKIAPLHYSEIGLTYKGKNVTTLPSDTLYGFSNTNASRIRKTPDGTAREWWISWILPSDFNAAWSNSKGTCTVTSAGSCAIQTSTTEQYVLFKIFV